MLNKLLLSAGLIVLGVQAGPPLICHPFQIGSAASLAWNGTGSNWESPDPKYDTHQLTVDTLRILDSGAPVLVRMETLRRATIYGALDHRAAVDLLASLRKRVMGSANALAYFDYGYLVASVHQMQFRYKDDITNGEDGYAYVRKALALAPEPDSGAMHFAAALVLSDPFRPSERDEQLRAARAAKSDALLAENVASAFR